MRYRLEFINQTGVIIVNDIIFLILLVFLWAKNVYCLKIALQFHRDVKANAYIKCQAKIIWAFGTSANTGFSRKYARAACAADGKQIRADMICAYDSRIDKGDKVTIIIPKSNPKIFAFSRQHLNNAVLTYSVLTIVFAFLSIGMTVIYLLAYFDR